MKYAKENNLLYGETSAKTGEGVKDIFVRLAKTLPIEIQEDVPEKKLVQITSSENDEFHQKKGCC